MLLQLEHKLKTAKENTNSDSEESEASANRIKSNSEEKPEIKNKPTFSKLKPHLGKIKMADPVNFGILAKPSVYSHTMDEDIREFLHQFENEAVANDWDDALKMKKIRIAFRGVALNLFDKKIKDYKIEPGKKNRTLGGYEKKNPRSF